MTQYLEMKRKGGSNSELKSVKGEHFPWEKGWSQMTGFTCFPQKKCFSQLFDACNLLHKVKV